jgi:1,3-beta-glucanosyltransferase GAS1
MSDVWSGGVAFSYLPAESTTGPFGMVTISPDGSTVTVSQDYTNLQAQYSSITPPTTPSQANAPAAAYPSCPGEDANLLASTTLPPTPSDAECNCLVQILSCLFTPQTNNITAVVGPLIDTTCGLLGSSGGNCNDIAGNGTSGVYGRVSICSPSKFIKTLLIADRFQHEI